MSEEVGKAMQVLGTLAYKLAELGTHVRIGKQDTLLSGPMVTLSIIFAYMGKTGQVQEAVSLTELAKVTDPNVLVDAIFEKLKRQIKDMKK